MDARGALDDYAAMDADDDGEMGAAAEAVASSGGPSASGTTASGTTAEDELVALASLLGLFDPSLAPPPRSSLDDDGAVALPDALAAEARADAADTSRRSRHIAALIATVAAEIAEGGDAIPVTLDATGLPEDVRRQPTDSLDVEAMAAEAAGAASARRTASAARDASGGGDGHGEPPAEEPLGEAEDDGSGDGVLTSEEERRLLAVLQADLARTRAGDAAAFEELRRSLAAAAPAATVETQQQPSVPPVAVIGSGVTTSTSGTPSAVAAGPGVAAAAPVRPSATVGAKRERG